MKTDIRRIAETLADEIQRGEKQAAAETRHQNNMWWRDVLNRQGLGHIWRKAIISQLLIEENCR